MHSDASTGLSSRPRKPTGLAGRPPRPFFADARPRHSRTIAAPFREVGSPGIAHEPAIRSDGQKIVLQISEKRRDLRKKGRRGGFFSKNWTDFRTGRPLHTQF